MAIYVVNTQVDAEGRRVPVDLPAGTSWVGNLYSKNNGNVHKYVLITETDISGLPGVFGPIDFATLEAAIEADSGAVAGWTVPDVARWSIGGAYHDGVPPEPPQPPET